MFETEIQQQVDSLSKGREKYVLKQATKFGFDTIYDYLMDCRIKKHWEQIAKKAAPAQIKYNKIVGSPNLVKDSPTEETMEIFLKSVGHIDPLKLPKGELNERSVQQLGTQLNLQTMMLHLTGKFLPESESRIRLAENAHEYFRRYEDLIVRPEMFWTLFPTFWRMSSIGFDKNTFEKHSRMSIPIGQRLECEEIFQREIDGTHYEEVNTIDYQLSRLEALDDEDEISIYRSFRVKRGKGIRKGIVKQSPSAHIHEEGLSWSYSFNKTLSKMIANNINTHLIKKYGGLD